MEGFTVILSEETLKQNEASNLERKPLEVLEQELKVLSGLMPPKTLTALRNVPIWVEWDEEVKFTNGRAGNALATYYGGHQASLLAKGMNPLKAKTVTVQRMKSLTQEHQPKMDSGRCVLLHEMTHAVQDQVLGDDNATIRAAYKQAMERKLLDKQTYAATNDHEFFAEMTCAYFDQLNYYPHNIEELKKSDPATFKLMESTWGKRKSGTTAKVSRGRADPDVLLTKLKLGKPVAGPTVSLDDLKGRPVLVVFWNAISPSSLTFLGKAAAWHNELSGFGLVTIGAHLTGTKEADVAAAAKSHGLPFATTDERWTNGGYVSESKDFPVALVFDRDGHCAYRGTAFEAEEAVRIVVGEALVARAGIDKPPQGLVPLIEALQKGKAPTTTMPRLAMLAKSPDADTSAAARTLLDVLTEGGRKTLEEAQATAADDPVAAYLRAEHLPATYKETAVAAKASELIAKLKMNRAVATEVRARRSLASIKKIEAELSSRPGSFDPTQERFRRDNAVLLKQLEIAVAQLKKSYPKALATEEALHVADKYGIGVP